MRRSLPEDATALSESVQESLSELKAFMPWSHFRDGNTVEAQTERIQGLVKLWDEGKDFTYNLFHPQADGTFSFCRFQCFIAHTLVVAGVL